MTRFLTYAFCLVQNLSFGTFQVTLFLLALAGLQIKRLLLARTCFLAFRWLFLRRNRLTVTAPRVYELIAGLAWCKAVDDRLTFTSAQIRVVTIFTTQIAIFLPRETLTGCDQVSVFWTANFAGWRRFTAALL